MLTHVRSGPGFQNRRWKMFSTPINRRLNEPEIKKNKGKRSNGKSKRLHGNPR